MNRKHALFGGLLLMLNAGAQAESPAGPVVVELFTSQGCNSCPPADALLGELAQRTNVLALAMHVTYWNDLGWRDVFSQNQFDQRQRNYALQTGRGGVYTPQMVVNGTQDVVGSQREAVKRVLDKAARPASISLHLQGDVFALMLPALERPCDCVVTLVGVRPSARTPIGRGENKGRLLDEFQIVRAIQSVGDWRGDEKVLQVKLSAMPADVSAYAVLAQDRSTGRVVAAGR